MNVKELMWPEFEANFNTQAGCTSRAILSGSFSISVLLCLAIWVCGQFCPC